MTGTGQGVICGTGPRLRPGRSLGLLVLHLQFELGFHIIAQKQAEQLGQCVPVNAIVLTVQDKTGMECPAPPVLARRPLALVNDVEDHRARRILDGQIPKDLTPGPLTGANACASKGHLGILFDI